MTQDTEVLTLPDETTEQNKEVDKEISQSEKARELREKWETGNLQEIIKNAQKIKDVSELKKDLNVDDYKDVLQFQTFQQLINATVNDERQKKIVKLATLDKYKIFVNLSDDKYNPDWAIIELEYFPVTVGAWNERRGITAKIEDMGRVAMEEVVQLMEYDLLIRQRRQIMNQQNTRMDALSLNESTVRSYGSQRKVTPDLQEKIQDKTEEATKIALEIYFHLPPQIYDKLHQEQLRDIVEACDLKQTHGVPNLANLSIATSTRDQQHVQ